MIPLFSLMKMVNALIAILFTAKPLPAWQNLLANKEALFKLKQDIKFRSHPKSDYDCLIGLSGGIDSSYLLHLAVNELNLNPLVFHVDAGWNSNIATSNIETLINNLNVDLYTEVINWREMRDLQISFFEIRSPHVDSPQDYAFFATMYNFANKYNIKTILTGANYSTECVRNPIDWMYFQSDNKQLRSIHKKFGNVKLKNFSKNTYFVA